MSVSEEKRRRLDLTPLKIIAKAFGDSLCIVEVVAKSLEGGSQRYVLELGIEKLDELQDQLGRVIRALEEKQ